MSVKYRLIAPTELESTLVDAWRRIQSKSHVFASPYFCPEFTQQVANVRDDVRIVVIEDAGRPVGFFPFQRSFLGMGEPVGGALSDYHGVIAEMGSEWNVSELFRSGKLTVWKFDHLVDESRKFEPYVKASSASPQIDLRFGYERYVQGRRDTGSEYVTKTEALARKMAREIGELNFNVHENTRSAMDCLIKWKSQQYRRARIIDAFAVRWTSELLRRIMSVQTAEFAGVCSVLRVAHQIVAVHLGMRSRQVFHYWFPAYDPDFARFSTGNILLLRMAEALANAGVRTIDLGKGDSQYKQRLMTSTAELFEGTVELPSLLARARKARRLAETHAAQGGMATMLRLPLKVIRRIEWFRKFR